MNCYGKSGETLQDRKLLSAIFILVCVCVCVCVEVRMNIHVMRISAGGHACLYSSCLDCLFWHPHCLCGASTAACGTVLGTRSENKISLKILPYVFIFPDNILNPEFTLWHHQFLPHSWGNMLHPNLKHLRWREEGTGTVIECCLSHLPSFAFPHVSVLVWVSTTYGKLGPHWSFVPGPWFKLKRLERALRFDWKSSPENSGCWIMQDRRSSFGYSSGSTESFYWRQRSSYKENRSNFLMIISQ